MDVAGVSLSEAFDMAGLNPCRLLNLEEVRLRRGSRADLTVFNLPAPGQPIEWLTTVSAGEVRCGSPPELAC